METLRNFAGQYFTRDAVVAILANQGYWSQERNTQTTKDKVEKMSSEKEKQKGDFTQNKPIDINYKTKNSKPLHRYDQ